MLFAARAGNHSAYPACPLCQELCAAKITWGSANASLFKYRITGCDHADLKIDA